MMEFVTVRGVEYWVRSVEGCVVAVLPEGRVLCRVLPGVTGSFRAPGEVVWVSDAAAVLGVVSDGGPGGPGGDGVSVGLAQEAAVRAEVAAVRAEVAAGEAEVAAGAAAGDVVRAEAAVELARGAAADADAAAGVAAGAREAAEVAMVAAQGAVQDAAGFAAEAAEAAEAAAEARVEMAALVYEDVSVGPEGATEDNYNAHGFGYLMPLAGKVLALDIACREEAPALPADTPIWVKVWRGETQELAAVSDNAQVHTVGAVLHYSFATPLVVTAGEELRVSFHAEDELASNAYRMGQQCCLRVLAKDSSTPGGMLGPVGGYGSEKLKSWVPKHSWLLQVERFARAGHEQDLVLHVWAADRTAWDAAAVHVGDAGLHVSAEERARWDAAAEVAGGASGGGSGVSVVLDAVPTEGSGNGVMSGGVFEALLHGGGHEGSVLLGQGAVVGAGSATALGVAAKGNGFCSLAAGYNALASGVYATALGGGSIARGDWSVAVGRTACVDGAEGVALGDHAQANGAGAVALGRDSDAAGASSVALGRRVEVGVDGVVALGCFEGPGFRQQTLLFLIAAGSPLAVELEGGAACLGYVVKYNGVLQASGTRRLADLLVNNVGVDFEY